MTAARLPFVLAVCCCLLWGGGVLAADAPKSLPFNKQSVYSFFRQVAEERDRIPENTPMPELQDRQCQLNASVLRQGGYDFETSVQNAVQFAERGPNKLDDPRFNFLAGVFNVHPDVYLRLKLISKATRDSVMAYFGQK